MAMGSSVVAPLHTALDGLAEVDDMCLTNDELAEALAELCRVEARLAARRAR